MTGYMEMLQEKSLSTESPCPCSAGYEFHLENFAVHYTRLNKYFFHGNNIHLLDYITVGFVWLCEELCFSLPFPFRV